MTKEWLPKMFQFCTIQSLHLCNFCFLCLLTFKMFTSKYENVDLLQLLCNLVQCQWITLVYYHKLRELLDHKRRWHLRSTGLTTTCYQRQPWVPFKNAQKFIQIHWTLSNLLAAQLRSCGSNGKGRRWVVDARKAFTLWEKKNQL